MNVSPRSDILVAIADVLLNLSAAWFGSIAIAPQFITLVGRIELLTLAMNAVAGMVAIGVAIKLRTLARS